MGQLSSFGVRHCARTGVDLLTLLSLESASSGTIQSGDCHVSYTDATDADGLILQVHRRRRSNSPGPGDAERRRRSSSQQAGFGHIGRKQPPPAGGGSIQQVELARIENNFSHAARERLVRLLVEVWSRRW